MMNTSRHQSQFNQNNNDCIFKIRYKIKRRNIILLKPIDLEASLPIRQPTEPQQGLVNFSLGQKYNRVIYKDRRKHVKTP